MQNFRMSWLLVILFLSVTFHSIEARHDNKKLPSVVVTGTIYCDTCFQQDHSTASHFISGASVAVECPDGTSTQGFREEVKTDEHGEFRVQLPSSVSKHLRKIKGCTVKLISSSEPHCAVASPASPSMHLKSTEKGEHIFSAGFLSFKPHKQPNICNQKPGIHKSKGLDSVKTFQSTATDFTFPPPLQDPLMSNLPPLPELPPLPNLPGLPGLPVLGTPLPPIPGKTKQSVHSEPYKPAQVEDSFLPLPPLPNLPAVPVPVDPPIPQLPPPIVPLPSLPPPIVPLPSLPPPIVPLPSLPPPIVPLPSLPPPIVPLPSLPPPLVPLPSLPPPIVPLPSLPPPVVPLPSLPPPLVPLPPLPPPLSPSFPLPPIPLIPGGPPASPSTEGSSP